MAGKLMLGATQEAVLNEDWLRTASWDVRNPDGSPVTDLKGLAAALGGTEAEVASELLSSASVQAAPPELVAEAKAATGGGGGGGLFADMEWEDGRGNKVSAEDPAAKPEEKALPAFLKDKANESADTGSSTRKATIAAGAFVTWSGGKGKVEIVVTSGKVPKVDTDIEGTKDTPAARVRVWKESDGKWAATDQRIGIKTSSLKTTAPLGGGFPAKKGHPEEELVTKLAAYAGDRPVTPTAVKAVYARGIKSHPGSLVTTLSPQEWGLGRVDAFLAKAAGTDIVGYVRDDDLL